MTIINTPPNGEFNSVAIDHQNLEGIERELEQGVGTSCGDCFESDAEHLEVAFGKRYKFSFLPKTSAQGVLYIEPISN